MENEVFKFYPGVSYRHCLIWDNGTTDLGKMTPPRDITGKVITDYLSASENAKPLLEMMKKSYDILKGSSCKYCKKSKRKASGKLNLALGRGHKACIQPRLKRLQVLKGGVVSAVDLIKGIGGCAEMEVAEVEGATGYIDTNFEGKAEAGLDILKRNDLCLYPF